MKRPWQVWLAFFLCTAVVASAMGWLTVHALRVDRERSEARAEVELEQRVSLALWRMDTKLAPLIAEEVTRPHEFYDSFITVSPSTAGGVEPVPSPLLTGAPPNVLLNFEVSPIGVFTCPQIPPADQAELAKRAGCTPAAIESNRTLLAELREKIDVDALIAQLPAQPLPQWFGNTQASRVVPDPGEPAQQVEAQSDQQPFLENYSAVNIPALDGISRVNQPRQESTAKKPSTSSKFSSANQMASSVADFDERNGRLQQAAQQEFSKSRGMNSFLSQNLSPRSKPVIESVSRPLWIGDQLLLARRVERDGQTFVQGSWLDWPRLKQELLAETADLLPSADLAPVKSEADAEPTRMLAGLPVQLVVADTAATLARLTGVDAPLQWALAFGWGALLLALIAVAGLLWSVLALSERRAAFVSSVTHELRTPLTTFRMYAEMLARDMVPSPERRREYLETLKTEAERLTHLVENVLSYARLERGRKPKRTERTTPGALVERFEPRLAERAARAEMSLACTLDDAAVDAPLLTDVGVVEQILFNLVDNAAKYAARASDRQILLSAMRDGKFVNLCVSDFGPGFASPRAAARSSPFGKSAQEAAESAPGVGLGLALCRRLARELGGRLEIAAKNGHIAGAAVTLRLPIEPRR